MWQALEPSMAGRGRRAARSPAPTESPPICTSMVGIKPVSPADLLPAAETPIARRATFDGSVISNKSKCQGDRRVGVRSCNLFGRGSQVTESPGRYCRNHICLLWIIAGEQHAFLTVVPDAGSFDNSLIR